MYIIFHKDGSIKESQLNDYVNQGSDGVNFVDVAIDGTLPDAYVASCTYTLPNGDALTDTGVYKSAISTSDGTYAGYRFTLHSAQTQYNGDLLFSLVATDGEGAQLFTYAKTITVNPTAGAKTTAVTWEEYKSLLAQLASYQLQYSASNVRHYATLDDANADISSLTLNQTILVGDSEGQEVYVVTEADGEKSLTLVALGGEALSNAFVHKRSVNGEVQAIHTGLVSYYVDNDDPYMTVSYGTDENDVPSWFVYCLDGDTYAGAITMGAKTYGFFDAHSSETPWLANNGAITKLISPSRTSKIELETGKASLLANTIDLDGTFKILDNGAGLTYTGKAYYDALTVEGGLSVEGSASSYIKSEGNAKALNATGNKTEVSDPSGANSILLDANAVTLSGSAQVEKAPTSDMEIANKKYVDDAIATGGDVKLNMENGTGTGSMQTRDHSKATGDFSYAFGKNLENGTAYSLAVGRDYAMSSSDLFAVGAESVYFGVGLNEAYFLTDKFTVGGTSRFDADATFKGDVTIDGNLTATHFTAIETTSLTTEQSSIGLAKGNTEPITSYIGLYAEKYDGTNYGALAWDKTGTAYVGDATVDKNGKILDPSNTLQPLLTRTDATLLSDGCVLVWDADGMRAEKSPYFSEVTDGLSIASGEYAIGVLSTGISFHAPQLPDVIAVDASGAHCNQTATEDTHIANKKYVDDNAGSPVILRVW